MSDVTQILAKIEAGDPSAADELLPLVYDELRALAAAKLAREKPGQTLQATALVHEAYLRLVNVDKVPQWTSKRHFFLAASEAMRRILVENARRKSRHKRGGDWQRIELDADAIGEPMPTERLIALDEALKSLEQHDPAAVELVKLRFIVGMTLEEAAQTMGISERTAARDWSYARAWLFRLLREVEESSTNS
jgi:RNA polymerase sigma factor (TIGR02999 family)